MTPSTSMAHRQRGAATLVVMLVLLFAIAIVVAYANRAILFEQRSTLNQVHAAQALEAADAGLDWAVAMLNHPARVTDRCEAARDEAERPFRDRALRFDAESGHHLPVVETVPTARCMRTDTGWSCSCSAAGRPATPAGDGTRPAFAVAFERGPQPGSVHLVATGCLQRGGPCAEGSTGDAATARVRVLLALVPGLAAAPAAALVVRGDVDVGNAALGLHNLDAASGGRVVDAGGSFRAPNARITTAPGASPALAVVERDEALAAADADALFVRHFGMDRATWAGQSVVKRVACSGDCGSAIVAAIDDGARLLSIDGDLQIDGPLTIGRADRPVILAVNGQLRLRGAVAAHGVAYAHRLTWNDTAAGGAAFNGALLSETGYAGNGAPELRRDALVLANLTNTTGSFVRVPGSWRDF